MVGPWLWPVRLVCWLGMLFMFVFVGLDGLGFAVCVVCIMGFGVTDWLRVGGFGLCGLSTFGVVWVFCTCCWLVFWIGVTWGTSMGAI